MMQVRQMSSGLDENSSLKIIGLTAKAFSAMTNGLNIFYVSNEMTMAMAMANNVLISGEWDSGAGSDCSDGVSELEGEEKEEEGSKTEEGVKQVMKKGREEEENDRRVIQPDICAISQLLNFDEVRMVVAPLPCNLCAKRFVLLKTPSICAHVARQLYTIACMCMCCHLPRKSIKD